MDENEEVVAPVEGEEVEETTEAPAEEAPAGEEEAAA